jgi:hypothetical protein
MAVIESYYQLLGKQAGVLPRHTRRHLDEAREVVLEAVLASNGGGERPRGTSLSKEMVDQWRR